jgi:hypothetical protein
MAYNQQPGITGTIAGGGQYDNLDTVDSLQYNNISASSAAEATLAKIAAEAAETSAASSADSASGSATTATTQAELATTNGAEQVSFATTQAGIATTQAGIATTQVGLATAQVGLATTQADNSATSASTATTQAELATTNGAEQVALATTQVGLATAQVGLAITQANNAATSASTATTQAELATTNGAEQVSLATTQAGIASSAQSAAESARDSALAAYDNFDDRYLGAKASDPTVDNDGNALIAGALYFSTAVETIKVYTGSTWVDAYADGSTFLAKVNNLSDLTNVVAARTNLGLGTAATTDSTAYATAAQGTLADSALQSSDISVSVQSYNVNTVIDSAYVHTDNNYTTTEKDKLNGIASGAEVNVNADWTSASGDSLILNKPTLGTAAATDSTAYATAAQGTVADSATQPADLSAAILVAVPTQTGNNGEFLTTDGTSTSWAVVDALPTQTGNTGKYLTTDGTDPSWVEVDALPIQTGNTGKYLTTDGTTASWAETTGGGSTATRTVTNLIATEGQTVFSPTNGYTVNNVDVYINGVLLQTSDYTATNGTTITLDTATSLDDEFVSVAWEIFETVVIPLQFSFFKSNGVSDPISLVSINKVPFFNYSSVSNNIPITT